jgi:hypothetical protein
MPNIEDKFDNAGQILPGFQFNPFKNSLQNTITDAGGTLIESDSLQFRQALNSYASIANFYIDTGTATEYVLNPQGAFKTPIDAPTTWNGMLIRFRPTNNNTGVATLRLAGLNGGLPFNILREDGTTIQAGDFSITRDAILRYNSTASAFMLLTVPVPNASQTNAGIIKTSTTALVNAGTDDLTAITPFQLKTKMEAVRTQYFGSASSWCLKYYDYAGNVIYMIQGGKTANIDYVSGNALSVTLYTAFLTECSNAIGNLDSVGGGNPNAFVACNARTTTGIQFTVYEYTGTIQSAGISWVAYGR